MSLKTVETNAAEKEEPITRLNSDDMQVTSEDAHMLEEVPISASEDTHLMQDISVPEDTPLPVQETSTSADTKQRMSTSNDKEMKDIEYHQDYWEDDSAKTDPMIRNEVPPIGSISSVHSLSKTGPTAEGHCRRHPIDLTKRQIRKNVIIVSFVFLLNFIAYGGLAALQSSLHVQEGMGVINQAVLYCSMALSCLTLNKIAISLLGHKWCMSVGLTGYLVWMAANGFGVWAAMLPASIILGICGATLWTAQASYFTILARHYAVKTSQHTAHVTSLFFGIFSAIFVNCKRISFACLDFSFYCYLH